MSDTTPSTELPAPNPRAVMGANLPPLDAQITEALSVHESRHRQLIALAQSAIIIDEESAQKCIDLAQLIRDLDKQIEDKRKDLVEPHLEAIRTINQRFHVARLPLTVALEGEDGNGGLRGMLDTFRKRQAAAAAEAKRKAEDDQRKRDEEAAEAQRKLDAARDQGTATVPQELATIKANEDARVAQERARAIRPEPVRAQLGQLAARREIVTDVVDLLKFLVWAVDEPFFKNPILQNCKTLLGRYARSIGVDNIGAVEAPPGATIRLAEKTMIRR